MKQPSIHKSQHEINFLLFWNGLRGPALVEEHVFHPTRKWRFDFAHLETMIAFELQGGVWRRRGGAHQGVNYERDCEKLLEASLLGWRVLQITAKQITTPTIERLITFVKEQL